MRKILSRIKEGLKKAWEATKKFVSNSFKAVFEIVQGILNAAYAVTVTFLKAVTVMAVGSILVDLVTTLYVLFVAKVLTRVVYEHLSAIVWRVRYCYTE